MSKNVRLAWIHIELMAVLACLLPEHLGAFNDNAHRALSRRAVATSKLHNFLTTHLQEFPSGIAEPYLGGRTVAESIQDGSVHEDYPLWRVRNHFHDPTKTWDQAGLGIGGVRFSSSVVWSQNGQGALDAGNYSWASARQAYLAALTSPIDSVRKRFFATVFHSIGHLIHLVQDAASPAHTRNDSHIEFFGDRDLFHWWGDQSAGLHDIATAPALAADPSVWQLAPNPLAPVAISRLIDTEGYRSELLPRSSADIGISEYSHANFFSDDTFVSFYPFPNKDNVTLCTEPHSGAARAYLCKIAPGDAGYRIAAATSLHRFLKSGLRAAELDAAVVRDYGLRLFPRAIGYSASLIDYFFRGKIKIEAPERFVYALAKYEAGNTGSFKRMRFKVSNSTEYPSTSEDTVGAGRWRATGHRCPGT